MIQTATLLVLSTCLSGVPVDVTTLDGQSLSGELTALSATSLSIDSDSGPQQLPVENLMLVAVNEAQPETAGNLVLTLIDQSQLRVQQCKIEGGDVVVTMKGLGEWKLPVQQVRTVQLAATDETVAGSWDDIKARKVRDDLLVFRKENVLDYVGGAVSKVSEESVTILVRNREMAAPRERVFGIVFANRTPVGASPWSELITLNGDKLRLKTASLKDEEVSAELLSGVSINIPLKQIESFDFGGGRLKFLADLPFDQSGSESPNPEVPVNWFVAKNFPAGSGGRLPLTIGKKTYNRGLWLHSGAKLRFRLNREFRELKAMAGFEMTYPQRMPQFAPRVKLIVEGDGQVLLSQEFDWQTDPAAISVDLSNVRELVIRVESLGEAKGILEHFALGDAQVIQ